MKNWAAMAIGAISQHEVYMDSLKLFRSSECYVPVKYGSMKKSLWSPRLNILEEQTAIGG